MPDYPKNELIKLEQLLFDPQNPRLPKQKRSNDDKEIIQWMLKEANIIELMESIATMGYSTAEPLLVTPDQSGKAYIVVEGNRRLAALKLLESPDKARLRTKTVQDIVKNTSFPFFPDTQIPVIVYKEREDILNYLGFRHITGIKSWGPRQKAEYLKQLFQAHSDNDNYVGTLSFISKMIGTKPYYARKLLTTLFVAEQAEDNAFWGSNELDDRIEVGFSVLHTALSYENIGHYIGLDSSKNHDEQSIEEKKTKNLLEWVCGTDKKISESRELKSLNSIIGNETALQKLESGYSLEIAASFSGKARDDIESFLNKALNLLTEADRLISQVDTFLESDVEEAKSVSNLARKIYHSIKNSFDEGCDD